MLLCLFIAQFRSLEYRQMRSVVYFDIVIGSEGAGRHPPTVLFLIKNQRDALVSQIYFWIRTLHVSESFSLCSSSGV